MSQSNLLQGYTWDAQYDDPHQQFSRPIQDEVISVYEVYVKEETIGVDGRSDISISCSEPGSSGQLMQGDCLDLDAAIGSEVINADGTITKLLGKDTVKYKILEENVNDQENVVVYSHPVQSEGPSASAAVTAAATRLVDKDDPRSRLHFVKYLKRDGKTLKIWECGICSKEFRHQYTLMRHLPTHTDERNFKCEACGKAFRQLSTLSQHRAIHSDARPYVCEFCKKTFNRVSTLISHRKTHSEHKPHKCHLCGKGFHQKGNLRNHVFTHTNERPYKCEICGKGFNQMSNLMCHKVKAHAHAEKMQYVCGICGKEFPRRFSLRSHEEYKHGIKYRHPNPPAIPQDVNETGVVRNKNVSIVSLANGDGRMIGDAGDKDHFNAGGYAGGVLIVDKIETKAMENAVLEGQTPFALFKPAKGIPVLVKVGNATSNRKQMLTPATAEDLRMAGKMSLSPTLADVDGVKAVQIKVPVVATVTQRIEADGSSSFIIEPPGPGQEQESLIEPIESQFSCLDNRGLTSGDRNSQDYNPSLSAGGGGEDCSDLLELAAQGGIQFVRATEDGRYEVMTNSEARDLMAQNSHDVTILDGEDAEAISVVNLRGENGDRNSSKNEEVVNIGDHDDQITVLSSGTNCSILEKKNFDDIHGQYEMLGDKDKDIGILESVKNLKNENCADIFDQEKLTHDFTHPGILDRENLHVSDVSGHLSLAKNHQEPINSLMGRNNTVISILNHNYQTFKHNQSLNDTISTILSSGDHHMTKNRSIDLDSKFKLHEFDSCDVNMDRGTGIKIEASKPEVKILGAKNDSKVKILSHSIMDTGEIDKSLQFGGNCSRQLASEKVKILGTKNPQQLSQHGQFGAGDYKDCRKTLAASCSGYGNQFASSGCQRKEDVKILGKKKEAQNENCRPIIQPGFRRGSNQGGFEVMKSIVEMQRNCRMPETIVIEDSPKYELGILQAKFMSSRDEVAIDILENFGHVRRDVEMTHVNTLNDHLPHMSSSKDYEMEDKIAQITSISERDFDMIDHPRPTRYNCSLPDLD